MGIFIISCFLMGASPVKGGKAEGEVWAWGLNDYGQLGVGDTTRRLQPVQTALLTDVIAIAGGRNHSLALKSDSTVWAWGYNGYGQLGIGSSDANPHATPIRTNLTDVIAIAAGRNHSLALKSDSTVWAWGDNSYGQLGDDTNTNRNQPVQTHLLTDVIAIAAGWNHSLALKSDGTVWTWGRNTNGQLGDNTNTDRWQPVQTSTATGLTDVIAIASGYHQSLALKSDGAVWAWGLNDYGQLGDNTTINHNQPVQTSTATGLTNVIAIAAGTIHSLALKSDSTVWAWGDNSYGELGVGDTIRRLQPVQTSTATGLTDVIAISGGYYNSLALKSDKTVWAWGYNAQGQLGDSTTTRRYQPVQTHLLTDVDVIAGAGYHSLAIKNLPAGVVELGYNPMNYLNVMPTIASQGFSIKYNIPKGIELPVSLRIYDQLGRVIRTLFEGTLPCGQYTTSWDACDEQGKPVPHGSYFCVLNLPDGSQETNSIERKKVIVIRE